MKLAILTFSYCEVFVKNSVNLDGKVTLQSMYIYRPQRSCGKVMFSQASVILFTGGVSVRTVLNPPPGRDPLRTETTPGQRPPRQRTPLYSNELAVRILLECILVWQCIQNFDLNPTHVSQTLSL